jgi:hypothetical protein
MQAVHSKKGSEVSLLEFYSSGSFVHGKTLRTARDRGLHTAAVRRRLATQSGTSPHTTWFFEEMILKKFAPDYKVFDEQFGFLFNSYYNSIGDREASRSSR